MGLSLGLPIYPGLDFSLDGYSDWSPFTKTFGGKKMAVGTSFFWRENWDVYIYTSPIKSPLHRQMEVIQGTWQYFPVEEIQLNRNNFLVSPCGTGKTTALSKWLSNNMECKIIVVTFRISLAYMLSKAYNFENYMELKHEMNLSLDEHPRTVVSIESLRKFFMSSEKSGVHFPLPDVLVMDEYCSIVEHAFNVKTLDHNRRSLFFNFVYTMLNSPGKTVIAADAFFSLELDCDCFLMLNDKFPNHDLSKYRIINNNFRKAARKLRIWQSPKNWKNYLLAISKKGQKKIFLFVNNKNVSDAITAELIAFKGQISIETSYPASTAIECLYLSSDSSPNDIRNSSLDPNTEWSNYNFVSVTPSIQAGVSFDVPDHFDMGFGFAGLGSSQPLGILQQLARVRNYTDNIIELCVQKQTLNKNAQRAYPTVNEVVSILESKVHSLKDNWARCCEVNYVHESGDNTLRFGLNPKSIINCFAIRVARAAYYAKASLLTAIVTLAELDSYTVEVMTPSKCKSITTAYIKDWRVTQLGSDATEEDIHRMQLTLDNRPIAARECFETSFPSTIRKHRVYKSEVLFNEWNGYFLPDESLQDAKSYSKMRQFIRDWNILGAYGKLDDLIPKNESFSLAYSFEKPRRDGSLEYVEGELSFDYNDIYSRCVEFNPKSIGNFYCEFVANDKQGNFHSYITGAYKNLLEIDKQEWNIGNTLNVSNANCFEFSVNLWGLFNICTLETLSLVNLFGLSIDLYSQAILSDDDDDIIAMKEKVDKLFHEVDECVLTVPDICESIRVLFDKYWDHIYPTLIDKKNSITTMQTPDCFTTPVSQHSVSQCLTFLKIVTETMKVTLNYIGLRIDNETKTQVRTASIWHHTGRRVRLDKYKILNFDERLLISYCRILKDGGYAFHGVPHYTRCDPFNLLVYQVQPGTSINNFPLHKPLRFKRYLWAYPKLGDGNEADSTILKDLQKWSIIDSANNNRDAVRLGEIDKDDNFSSVILPSLHNIRYYWSCLKIGRTGELPLSTKLDFKLLKCSRDVYWLKYNQSLYIPEALNFHTTTYEEQREWMNTEVYLKTGLLQYDLLNLTDTEITNRIKERHKCSSNYNRGGSRITIL